MSYTAPSGAVVFSDGSLQLAWALDDFGHSAHADPAVQRLFANIFDSLGAPPGTAAPTSGLAAPPVGPGVPADLLKPGLGPFALRSPRPSAVLWSPQPRLVWTPSHDPDAGSASYLVFVDGRLVKRTPDSAYALGKPLRDGPHYWKVIAVDRAGKARQTPARRLVIRSVRVQPRSRARVLAHGLEVRVYCVGGCLIRARLRVGAHGPADRVVRHRRRAGTAIVSVPLSLVMRARASASHSRPLLELTVRTRTGRETREVSVRTRL